MVDAFRRAHADPVGAARAEIYLMGRHREAARSPLPAFQVLGFGPRLKDEAAWRVEDAREDELGRGLLRRGTILSCGHASSPSLAVCADTRPDDRSSPPKNVDSARATLRRPSSGSPRAGRAA